MQNTLPIINVDIDDLDETTGVNLFSMVEAPAMESEYLKLSEQVAEVHLSSNKQKQNVTGAAIIPDKLIYRRNEKTGEEFYLKFSTEVIEKIRNKFFKTGNLKLSNLDHNQNDIFEAYLVEAWIVEDPEKDKATALGLSDVKKGALYLTYHIPDSKHWDIVSEKTTGFSLEGVFNMNPEKLAAYAQPEPQNENESIESVLEDLIKTLQNND